MPIIVCLCGSTKFKDLFEFYNFIFTKAGKIVLTVGGFHHSVAGNILTSEEKYQVDVLHFAKIDLADEVFIINKGKYIGESTIREIYYAKMRDKKIIFMEGD